MSYVIERVMHVENFNTLCIKGTRNIPTVAKFGDELITMTHKTEMTFHMHVNLSNGKVTQTGRFTVSEADPTWEGKRSIMPSHVAVDIIKDCGWFPDMPDKPRFALSRKVGNFQLGYQETQSFVPQEMSQ